MTDKKEGTKGVPHPAESSDQKRPHATLNLKATEVKAEKSNKAETKASSASTADASADKTDTGSKPKVGKTAAESQQPNKKKASSESRAPARGGIWTHLAAGLAGGAAVLFGADYLPQMRGSATAVKETRTALSDLNQRVETLEQSSGPAADTKAIEEKLSAAEKRLAKLDEVSNSLGSLTEAQANLQQEATSLSEKLNALPPASVVDDRLAKLEEQLATIAAAAGTDPEAGGIQGLAAITGKMSDLEGSVESKLAASRKALAEELEPRITAIAEASEAARTGTQRIDREVADLRSEAARLSQKIETLEAGINRLGGVQQVLQEESASLASGLDSLRGAVALPGDVASAVTPLSDRLTSLERNLETLARTEDARRANAERVVIALELANLKRAVDSGKPYASELAHVKKTAGERLDLAALDQHQDTGVPSLATLEKEFKPVIRAVIDAAAQPRDGGLLDRFVATAKSIVKVRKVQHEADDTSAEAVIGRMEDALTTGQLDEVLIIAKDIPAGASNAARGWLAKVEARHAVDRAIALVEAQMKSSLSGTDTAPVAPSSLQN